jgi:hypothetical protein
VTAVQEKLIALKLKEILGLAASQEPYDMMSLGYPAMKSRPK